MDRKEKQIISNEMYFFRVAVECSKNVEDQIDEIVAHLKKIVLGRGNIDFADLTFNSIKNYLIKIIVENEMEDCNEWKIINENLLLDANEIFDQKRLNIVVKNLEKIKQLYLVKNRNEKYTGYVLNHLHGTIRRVSISQFQNACYADAVENACKAINERLKSIYKNQKGAELDGDTLFTSIFSVNNPIIKLGDLSTQSGKNVQRGYMMIFHGMWAAIRDPKSHGNINITKEEALEKLVFASLLMNRIDEGLKLTAIEE